MEFKEQIKNDLLEQIKLSILDIEDDHMHQINPQSAVVPKIISTVKHYIR